MPRMNPGQRQAYWLEIGAAKRKLREGKHDEAFRRLERAHVLGQAFIFPHVLSHWLMFRLACMRGERAAAAGQLVRLALGGLGSAIGSVPTGNTGGSNVGMFRRMPVDPELAAIMREPPAMP